MPTTVVVGTQWGDEGKGKVVDFLARDADIIVRSQGGNNAGHTVAIDDDIFRLYHLPCGVLQETKTSIIGSGMALNPLKLWEEIEGLRSRGISCVKLIISHQAHLIMPYHMILDGLEETRRTQVDKQGMIGTTRRGIGPVFADKMSRSGFRICDLYDPASFRERVRTACEDKNVIIRDLYGGEPVDADEIADSYLDVAEKLKPYVGDAVATILKGLEAGQNILFEGAQGTLLDIDYGLSYPFLTSSHPVSAGACLGTGLAPNRIDRILGVVKAYVSRVGEGPFPTELSGDLANSIRDRGKEYGTATGRPRRVGWLDLVLLKYAARINGLTEMVLTKVDVMDDLREVKIAISYDLDGKQLDFPPSDPSLLSRLKPVYKAFQGWRTDTTGLCTGNPLPGQLEAYMRFVSDAVGVPITLLGVGNRRCQMVEFCR
jgi:adenylosuccinate synthase